LDDLLSSPPGSLAVSALELPVASTSYVPKNVLPLEIEDSVSDFTYNIYMNVGTNSNAFFDFYGASYA
jgi:hypothetical protein